ncbi:MAG TPA: hypothetical protein VK797_20745 [Tepidisphaeraceae bacterium]|jgi:hypothetical protein|nr:hypothetical protein [Tepidisphaeraceae bacterium]
MDYQLDRIADMFESCLRDCAVFERADRPLVERDILRKEAMKWVVLAAGIDALVAAELFPDSGKKASFAGIPLRVSPGAQASLLLVLRRFDPGVETLAPHHHLASYAPGDGIPYVAIREGYIRITHLPDGVGLDSIRWELDPHQARNAPIESWLRTWYTRIGFNPAHSPSHLHFNSLPKVVGRPEEPSTGDFRLAMGAPNPLRFPPVDSGVAPEVLSV